MKAEKTISDFLCYPRMYREGNAMKTCLVTFSRATAEAICYKQMDS